jgi:hypothetical protein
MRATILVVVLGGSVFGLERAYRTAPPAPTPTATPKPDPTPPGRTWESRTMRTTATSTTAAWRKTSTRPLEVEDRPAVDAQPQALLAEEKETIVFRGEYSLIWRGCFRTSDGGWACGRPEPHPTFAVTEVLRGNLPAKAIAVPPWSRTDARFVHSRHLKEGTVYSLRFTPSEQTRQDFREDPKANARYSLSTGDELVVIESEE